MTQHSLPRYLHKMNKNIVHKMSFTITYIGALHIIAQNWKQFECPLTVESEAQINIIITAIISNKVDITQNTWLVKENWWERIHTEWSHLYEVLE